MSGSFLSGSMFADIHVKRGKAASIISVDSDTTIGGRSNKEDGDSTSLHAAVSGTGESEASASANANANVRHGRDATVTADAPTPTPSSFTNTLTSGISNAMRLLLNNGELPRASMFASLSKNHHGLLTAANADAFAIDERPHIKYDWTIGKRLKFSCTVYYAKQFDNLRRRCGIEDVFVKSLSRSANWAAEGGKSKSNFWKTADDRFIIKTLVNAWNVADL
jgi:1-phosphatidylinositol-3-phosphate 5-kinase